MKSKAVRSVISLVVLAAFFTATTACYGPFNLTRVVYKWNGNLKGRTAIETKWFIEGVFLLLALLPVYGLALLADALIFNSIQFWTGNNPIESTESADGKIKTVRLGDITATMTLSSDGRSANVVYAKGAKIIRVARLVTDGQDYRLLDANGEQLYSARPTETGSLTVADKDCHPVGVMRNAQVAMAIDRILNERDSSNLH
jgi:hypothetical protein